MEENMNAQGMAFICIEDGYIMIVYPQLHLKAVGYSV